MVFRPQGQPQIVVNTTLKSWSKSVDVLLESVDEALAVIISSVFVDEFNSLVYVCESDNNANDTCTVTDLSGNVKLLNTSGGGNAYGPLFLSSLGGLYSVFFDLNGDNAYVVGAGSLLQTISLSEFTEQTALAGVSLSGVYIAIAGGDKTHPNRKRLQIWKGS